MYRIAAVTLVLGLVTGSASFAQQTGAADQIEGALLAAPPSLRAGAEVLGIGGAEREGDVLTTLRAGTNELICLADDPEQPAFQVSCYHASLEPYMRFGRVARSRGLDRAAVMDARYEAYTNGRLPMPPSAALYNVSAETAPPPGDRSDPAGLRRLTVVYLPGATLEETGLPGRPEDGIPWLMLPGTPWAHIMISH